MSDGKANPEKMLGSKDRRAQLPTHVHQPELVENNPQYVGLQNLPDLPAQPFRHSFSGEACTPPRRHSTVVYGGTLTLISRGVCYEGCFTVGTPQELTMSYGPIFLAIVFSTTYSNIYLNIVLQGLYVT